MKKSIFEGEYYNIKIIDLGDSIEIYKYSNWIRKNNTRCSNKHFDRNEIGLSKEEDELIKIEMELRKELDDPIIEEMKKEENRKRSLRRTKDRLIKILETNSNSFSSFITLTFKEDIEFAAAKYKLKQAINKIKKDYKDFIFCWVLELTERGRPHFHLLTNYYTGCSTGKKRKTKEQKVMENDFCSKYWKYGFATIENIESAAGVIRYLTSYLTKDVDGIRKNETKGQRIYSYSRSLEQPQQQQQLTYENTEEVLNRFLEQGDLIYSKSYGQGEYKENEVTFFKIKKY